MKITGSSSSERSSRGERLHPGTGRPRGPRRKRNDPFAGSKGVVIHHLDVHALGRFLDDSGRIVPARRSGASAKSQRRLGRALKRARQIALLPIVRP